VSGSAGSAGEEKEYIQRHRTIERFFIFIFVSTFRSQIAIKDTRRLFAHLQHDDLFLADGAGIAKLNAARHR
jgi:hypothetical protein